MENKNQETMKPNKETFAHKVGDSIEQLGEKITEKGFPKAGEAIGRVGDKIEHLQDKKADKDMSSPAKKTA